MDQAFILVILLERQHYVSILRVSDYIYPSSC